MHQLDTTLDQYLVKKAPGLPAKWQEVLVKFLPWITLVVIVLALPALLVVLGIGTLVLPFSIVSDGGVGLGLAMIVLAATIILEALAIPGLFKRKMSGWRLLYYSALLNGVHSILTLNIGGLLIGTLLSLYLLFQIKHHYS
jgi:hypothetical protein